MSDWTSAKKPPKKDGRYLVTIEYEGEGIVDVLSYAKDLYERNSLAFYGLEGKSGFYDYDSEWGDFVVDDVIAWKPLDEPYGGEE